jgi:hypothetical protein
MAAHVTSCANRTDKCEVLHSPIASLVFASAFGSHLPWSMQVCQRFIKVVDMTSHNCIGEPTSASEPIERTVLPRFGSRAPSTRNSISSAAIDDRSRSFECPYCSHAGFKDATSVERHVASECRVARSFSSSQGVSNQRDETEASHTPARNVFPSSDSIEPVTVRELLQGRLRRKDDAARIVRTRFPPIVTNNQTASDALSRPSQSGTRKSTPASACAAKPAGRATTTSKKAPVQTRALTGGAASDLLGVRSSSCVLSAPVTPAKRQPRRHLAPS